MGYPINQNTSLDEFYKWYVEKKLYCVSMNNVGDPCRRERDSNYSMNTHEFEREAVDYFAKLYAFKNDDYWGFVTTSGTDGNCISRSCECSYSLVPWPWHHVKSASNFLLLFLDA